MRRALILILLLLGMSVIQPLAIATPGSAALLTFGFLILAAYTVGEIVAAAGLPKLVGYLLAGMAFAPTSLGTLTDDVVARLTPVNQLAVALIALLAGAELRWSEIRTRGAAYLRVIGVEMAVTFAAGFCTILLLRNFIPALAGRNFAAAIVFALLFSAVYIAHSPAATFGVLTETKARGPVARTTLGVILLSDVVLIIVFALAVALARVIIPPPGDVQTVSAAMVVWEIAGALAVGAAIGFAITVYLRFTNRELLLFGIIVAMLGGEIARLAHVELLLTLLTAGFVMENFTPREGGEQLRHAVARAAAPVFVVFFALAGATIHVRETISLLSIVGPLVAIRVTALWLGSKAGARWAGMEPIERRFLWRGLVSQSGVAIGLATAIALAYPELGGAVRAVAFAMIAINELIGPIIFKRALGQAGEIVEDDSPIPITAM